MANLNQVNLIGRLTRDPELRYTQGGTAVTEFSIAINKEWTDRSTNQQKKEVTFVDVTAWARTAEVICKYMAKGRELFVNGELKLDRWEAQDGSKRQKLKVVANFVQFLGGGGNGGGRRAPSDDEAPPHVRNQSSGGGGGDESGDEDFGLDEDVPF